MGFLKLSSIYKKNKKKETTAPAVPSTTPKLEPISLELNLDLNDTKNQSSIIEQQPQNVPAGPGSLFDDIFAELKSTPAAVTQEVDTIENDFSLALALSQQLSVEENNTKMMTGTTKQSNNNEKSATNNTKFLFGEDSIYSSYLRNVSAIEGTSDSMFSTSMFDSMINKNTTPSQSAYTTAPTATTTTTTTTTTTVVTQVVLDSDISDTDEESKHSDGSEEEVELSNQDTKRMTKGLQPIMDRRGPNLSVQRKIDSWSNRLDNGGDVNETVIERMKDRHRHQVKLAALRQQQQQQQQQDYTAPTNNNIFGNQHMVPQAYVAPAVPIPQNIVLPHPGVLVDPAQMYYPPPEIMSPLPNNHVRDHQKPTSDRSSPSNNSNSVSPNASSVTLPSMQEYESSHDESPPNEEFGAEADAESSGDEQERKSHELRKQRSMKKLRQKSEETTTRQIRSSRSAPNLKKKKSSKTNSRASSRRNSQDLASSPSSEMIKTPPPLPHYEHTEYNHLPRSNSQHQFTTTTSTRHSIRHMKSEPEFSRHGHQQQQHYQQQLSSEWERMQAFQREQQLKQQYQLKHQMSMVYTPVYYPTIPSYSGSIDHRTSQMGMLYQQQQQPQQHYYSSR